MRFALLTLVLLLTAACKKQVSTTDLRLEAKSEGERQWLVITAPEGMTPANAWITECLKPEGPRRVEVLYQSPRVLSLACRTGEAGRYASFRIPNGQRLTLSNTIQQGMEEPFIQAVEQALAREKRPLRRPTEDFALKAMGLVFRDGPADIVIGPAQMRPLLSMDAALLVGR